MNVFYLLFIGLVIGSCTNSLNEKTIQKPLSNYEKLDQYCKENNQLIHQYKTIIVINEIGSCINCNNIFAKSQASNLSSDSTLFIVSGVGTKVDLSAYINTKKSNLIFDERASFDTLKIVKSCAIISLTNDSIENIELINVKTVNELSNRTF